MKKFAPFFFFPFFLSPAVKGNKISLLNKYRIYGSPQGIRGTAGGTCHDPPETVFAGEKSMENPLSSSFTPKIKAEVGTGVFSPPKTLHIPAGALKPFFFQGKKVEMLHTDNS